MRKVLIFFLCALLAGSIAMASDTRVTTMGEVNNIVKDDFNPVLYPQTITNYTGLFTAEFHYDNFYLAGANFGFNEEKPWAIGVYFTTEDYRDNYLFNNYGTKHPRLSETGDHRIDFFYGREILDMPFGVNLNLYRSSAKNEDTTIADNFEWAYNHYGLTLGLSPMEGKLEVAAGINKTSWTDRDYHGYMTTPAVVDATKPSGNTDIFLRFRYWMEPRGKYVLIPHGELMLQKEGLEGYYADTVAVTYTNKETTIDLGLGMNYEAKEDVLVVTDFGIRIESENDETEFAGNPATEDKTGIKTLPYFKIGIDAKVFKWMDFRAGVSNDWNSTTNEPSGTENNSTGTTNVKTYLGAGFHWGDFEIDAQINPDFVENGPYFISGRDSYLTEKVSIGYWFD